MRKFRFVFAVFFLLPMGCATISGQAKMEEYGRTMNSYETAMNLSDFNAACQFVDSSKMEIDNCLKRYDNIKLVSYEVTRYKISEDKTEVNQAVEVEYFFLDRYVVKKMQYTQKWQYKEEMKNWLLQAGPPLFE
jgi:hypothetical protein